MEEKKLAEIVAVIERHERTDGVVSTETARLLLGEVTRLRGRVWCPACAGVAGAAHGLRRRVPRHAGDDMDEVCR